MKPYAFIAALVILFAVPAHAEITYTLDEDYGDVPVTFVPNVGQFDSSFVFAAEGNNNGEYSKENSWELNSKTIFTLSAPPESYYSEVDGEIFEHPGIPQYYPGDREYPVYLRLIDANLDYEVAFEDPVSWSSNYFIGNDASQWHTDVPNYRTIRLRDIYPDIDITGTGNGRAIDYKLVIHPGADLSQIQFSCDLARYIFYESAERPIGTLTINDNGELIYSCTYSNGTDQYRYSTITQAAPRCWLDGQEVDIRYYFIDEGHRIVGLEYGEYDSSKELTVELPLLFLSGIATRNSTGVSDIAVDDEGSVYVAGGCEYWRTSMYTTHMKSLFAMKLNEAGDALEYATHFGGLGGYFNSITDIAVDNTGNLCVAGWTQNENFPLTQNASDKVKGHNESFIIILSQSGESLVFSSYWGGSDIDYIRGIDIYEDKIYLTGKTYSKDYFLTNDAIDTSFDPWNGFLSILNYETGDILYSSYFYKTSPRKIFVNNSGTYISGHATTNDHPTTENAFITDYQGGLSDAFVTKLSPDATEIVYSTLIGGAGEDLLSDLFIDDNGNAIVTGSTDSSDFPITTIFIDSPVQGQKNSFVTKLNEDGSNIDFSDIFGFDNANNAVGIEGNTNGQSVIINDSVSGSYVTDINSSGTELLHVFNIDEKVIDFKINKDNELILLKKGDDDANQFPVKYHIDSNGTYINEQNEQISLLNISPPYPNPFNPIVTLSYNLPQPGQVAVTIYNLQGQLVDTLVNEYQPAGTNTVTWNAVGHASGLYFYRIESGNSVAAGKMLLMK